MNREQYLLLFEKFLAGNATPEEVEIILSLRDSFDNLEPVSEDEKGNYKAVEDRLLKKLKSDIGYQETPRFNLTRWIAAAAAVLLVGAGAFLFKYNQNGKTNKAYTQNVDKKGIINPGANNALLTLANGKKIILNNAAIGTLIKQGNIIVKKQKDGILQYSAAQTNEGENQVVEYNTISTPRGGQYQIILPDSTKVWLNSSSSLKFPTAFIGKQRIVELTGEGYFEVTKNKHLPFKVKFNNQEVEVLGTHFDIMAYSDETESRTSLFEGSVKISKGNYNTMLVPGQQAASQISEGSYRVEHADMEKVLAWKNGYFLFKNTGIQEIMRQVARWYDVDVVYSGSLEDKIYGGRVSKSKDITEILRNLELTGTIHFKIEGRRVTVMQ